MKPIHFKELILFEDEDYIVINKPSFYSTLDDRNPAKGSILDLARKYVGTAQICHRLDKETSGTLAIAKNPEAYRNLSMQFEDRKVSKVYHAVSDGIHDFNNKHIDLPILSLSRGVVKIDRRGKSAETMVNTLRAYKMHTFLECMPVTGRMHQIRVHLSAVNAPIAGDTRYGGQPFYLSRIKKRYNLKKDTEELPLIRRIALHARSLAYHGLNSKQINVEAPYPKDFAVLLKQLEKNG